MSKPGYHKRNKYKLLISDDQKKKYATSDAMLDKALADKRRLRQIHYKLNRDFDAMKSRVSKKK